MRKTISHTAYIENMSNDLTTSLSWDTLRLDTIDTPYSIPEKRDDWIKKCLSNGKYIAQAKEIIKITEELGYKRIFSVGVGGAWLEYNIKQLKHDLHITCTDYAIKTIKRLRSVFIDCDKIEVFDIIKDNFPQKKEFILLNRIDTEFDDKNLKKIYSNMANNGIENILVIATHILTIRYYFMSQLRIIINKFRRRKMIFAGYSRTKSRFIELFEDDYFILREKGIDGVNSFLLQRKKN